MALLNLKQMIIQSNAVWMMMARKFQCRLLGWKHIDMIIGFLRRQNIVPTKSDVYGCVFDHSYKMWPFIYFNSVTCIIV